MSKQKSISSFFKPITPKVVSDKSPERKRIRLIDKCGIVEDNKLEINVVKEKLNDLSKDYKIVDVNMGESWFNVLHQEFVKPYFKKLNEFVTKERSVFKVYPDQEHVWSWTRHCRLKDVKVVIIGQDPYHNPQQAHGLCFSVKKGVRAPPSLVNIYKELATDIPNFKNPGHGDLTKWAEQGVLLLNACLTVRENTPNSHSGKGWENVTDAVIKAVSEKNNGVVFLLWGAFAQKKAACVDKKKHHLLNAPHPSPLSVSRGFFGCKHFSKCNEILTEMGKTPIIWQLD